MTQGEKGGETARALGQGPTLVGVGAFGASALARHAESLGPVLAIPRFGRRRGESFDSLFERGLVTIATPGRGLRSSITQLSGIEFSTRTRQQIRDYLHESELVVVTARMGGDRVAETAPQIAAVAREEGALTIGLAILPSVTEGVFRSLRARKELDVLQRACDTTVVLPTDRILNIFNELGFRASSEIIEKAVTQTVRSITEIISHPALINLDYNDIRTIMKDGGTALLGIGSAEGPQRIEAAVHDALQSPLLNVDDVANATGALIHVMGGYNLTVSEAERAAGVVGGLISKRARMIWGCSVDPALKDEVSIVLLISGVPSATLAPTLSPTAEQLQNTVPNRLPSEIPLLESHLDYTPRPDLGAIEASELTSSRPDSWRFWGGPEVPPTMLPGRKSPVKIFLPKLLIARELTDDIPTGPALGQGAGILYDAQTLHARFYVVEVKFGIDPDPSRVVESVSFATMFSPACRPSGSCIRIYNQAPESSWKVTGAFDSEVMIHGNLGVSVPAGTVHGLNAGGGIAAKAVYTAHLKFARAVISTSTNGNDIMTWTFRQSPEGEDPRGGFQLLATMSIPNSIGATNEVLSSTIRALVEVQAVVDAFPFTRRSFRADSIPVVFS